MPPLKEKPWWAVIAPVGQSVLRVVFLDDVWTGYPLHYIQEINKNLPCSQRDDCWMCQRGSVARWAGFAAVLRHHPPAERVLAITHYAAWQLKPFLEKEGTLRGLSFDLVRRPPKEGGAPKKNDPVSVTLKGRISPDKLPPAFNVLDSLERMWGCNLAFFSQTHPDWGKLGQASGGVGADASAVSV